MIGGVLLRPEETAYGCSVTAVGERWSRRIALVSACAALVGAIAQGGVVHAAEASAADLGLFSRTFVEPSINGVATNEKCVPHKGGGRQPDRAYDCKPAAVTLAINPDGSAVYFNGIEGSEGIQNGIAAELGHVSGNDLTRVMRWSRGKTTWTVPTPEDGGANPKGYDTEPILEPLATTETHNDGGLFCADANFLPDGRLMVAGGTAFYSEPGVDGVPYGLVELEGLRNVRFFDAKTNRWTQGRDMTYGRWYPTLVTLGDGRTFVASGVQKLLKPMYPSHPTDSGRNVVQTETFDPRTGKWTYNGESADRSLPLFPRLHLLPNGHVYYNAAGQVFNPMGEAYDEALWNFAASYDPKAKAWTDLGIPGIGTLAPGFHGSTFSMMLPLSPKDGYTKARFLTAGGVLGVTPGMVVANPFSAITTVDTKAGDAISSVETAPLNAARWYGTAVGLPTGEVVVFNGADRDEVMGPGFAFPVQSTELFDPKTNEWRVVASSRNPRTYHNTASLMPDGRVLIGGHAPISTGYGANRTLPGGFSPNDGRDPSFELYSPPYLFRGARPEIGSVRGTVRHGNQLAITTNMDAKQVESVMLVRNTSITHLVDADQRTVELPVTSRSGRTITVRLPKSGNVAPPGPYMLFVNARSSKGPIPSVAHQLSVPAP